jgi:hypothetical protein
MSVKFNFLLKKRNTLKGDAKSLKVITMIPKQRESRSSDNGTVSHREIREA